MSYISQEIWFVFDDGQILIQISFEGNSESGMLQGLDIPWGVNGIPRGVKVSGWKFNWTTLAPRNVEYYTN